MVKKTNEQKTVSVREMLKNRPTRKDRVIARNLLRGTTQKEACMAAGYSERTAHGHNSELVNRPGVQQALIEALERQGGTKDRVAETMVAGLNATKRNHAGALDPDFTERRRSAEAVATFAGWKPAAQVEVAQGESYADKIFRWQAERGGKPIDFYSDENDDI